MNGKEVFRFRNVITNPRQPSPIFMKVDEIHQKDLLEIMNEYKEKIESAKGVKVNYHIEDEI